MAPAVLGQSSQCFAISSCFANGSSFPESKNSNLSFDYRIDCSLKSLIKPQSFTTIRNPRSYLFAPRNGRTNGTGTASVASLFSTLELDSDIAYTDFDQTTSNAQGSDHTSNAQGSDQASQRLARTVNFEATVDSATLDRWIKEAITEIVGHIQEAPFLQYVPKMTSKPERYRVTEGAFKKPEDWISMKDSVLQNDPAGMILVRRLEEEVAEKCWEASDLDMEDASGRTDTWGVLVQAKKVACHACYILKTTQIVSSAGACTRFCLTRAQCFGPSLQAQLERSWLL